MRKLFLFLLIGIFMLSVVSAVCGDNIVEAPEVCDDNNINDCDGCKGDCSRVDDVCGDEIIECGEGCDDGNINNNDNCLNTCQPAYCGDGYTLMGVEQCDDANQNNNDGCQNCLNAVCGDGFIWDVIEDCDDLGESVTCDDDCTPPLCGDGNVNELVGETCDDGNLVPGDGCYANCTLEPWITISTCEELQGIGTITGPLNWNYILVNDIDCSKTSPDDPGNVGSIWDNGGLGFDPIGCGATDCGSRTPNQSFNGTFDGQGFEITRLYINRGENYGEENYVGLFGSVGSLAEIRDVGLFNVYIAGEDRVGGLVGDNEGDITNSYSVAIINGGWYIGGLVGDNEGDITNSYSAGNVTGSLYTGGLVGEHFGTITDSYSKGDVIGEMHAVGGLTGSNFGDIYNSYSTGNVDCGGCISSFIGGLVGEGTSGFCYDSFWDNETSGRSMSGGGIGKTTAEMTSQHTFTNWDFGSTWKMDMVVPADTYYPCLTWQDDGSCPVGYILPVVQIRWENMNGVPIMTSNIGNLVRMVKTSASSGDFEIREDDGESGDDNLYTIADGNAITGVSENGNLVGTWRITQDDFNIADEGIELDDGHIEAYFTIGSDVSGNLNISDEYIDNPMNITLESLKCGENLTQGMTTWINITALDSNDKIMGNISIDGEVHSFSNGVKTILYTWSRAGNLQVEVSAVNSGGFSMRKIISVMITDGSTADYVAACIDKPADFSDITSSNVRFDASNSRGLKCTLGVCQEVGVTGLWFTWKFSDNTFNFNHDGGLTELAYKFYKNYITTGHNWAELDVRMK